MLSQNPFSRLSQIIFGILGSISIYLSTNIFFFAADLAGNYELYGNLIRFISWSMYLPVALLYHASLFLNSSSKKAFWQKIALFYSYIGAAALIVLEIGTNIIRNYAVFSSPEYTGILADANTRHFWLLGAFFIPVLLATGINFYTALSRQVKFSQDWWKFFWPVIGLLLAVLLAPFILLSYYQVITYTETLPIIEFILIALPLSYSIVRHGLFINEAKTIFGKPFLYSTFSVSLMLLIYFALTGAYRITFISTTDLILPFALSYLIIASHPLYDWLNTFARDLAYYPHRGLSVVNDDEIGGAIRNYHNPANLENSTLLRLKLIDRAISKKDADNKVDALRYVIKEAVKYFKPDENRHVRTKQNIKYQLLKLLLQQAEEGQILWELGFEEYPVRIMQQEGRSRPPLFSIKAASDYTYTSRNAYLALKKEAIHDVAWRISYLEKHLQK